MRISPRNRNHPEGAAGALWCGMEIDIRIRLEWDLDSGWGIGNRIWAGVGMGMRSD